MTPRATLKSLAYTAIRDAIVSGKLSPATPLSEAELQQMLGMSRTPIREALQRLADEGLVTLTPHKGAVVTGTSVKDCQDVFYVREMLEGLAAALASRRMSDQLLDTLTAEYERVAALADAAGEREMISLGRGLHATILEASASPRLQRLMRLVGQEVDRLGTFQLRAKQRVVQAFHEHGEIIAALRARDAGAAEAAMRYHVRRSADTAVRLVLEAGHPVGSGTGEGAAFLRALGQQASGLEAAYRDSDEPKEEVSGTAG